MYTHVTGCYLWLLHSIMLKQTLNECKKWFSIRRGTLTQRIAL